MPSWDVHRGITLAALSMLGDNKLSEDMVKHLLEGVVDPDRVPDKEPRLRLSRRGNIYASMSYARHHGYQRDLVDYYFNLALYYHRRGDGRKSMLMLGRALHYAQDSSLSRRKLLVIDVHEIEEDVMNKLANTPQRVLDLCKGVVVDKKEMSSRGDEAVCIALEKTKSMLKRFTEEIGKAIDIRALRNKVIKIRLLKTLLVLALTIPAFINQFDPMFIGMAFITCIAVYVYKPRTYYEAMRAGLMIVKPIGYKPAYT